MFIHFRKIATSLKPKFSNSLNKLYSHLPLRKKVLNLPSQHSPESLTSSQLKALVLSRFSHGKFVDLFQNVVASPSVLLTASRNLITPPFSNAPDSLPLSDLVSKCFSVEVMARELSENRFDVGACCVPMAPLEEKGRTGFADDDCLYFIAAVEWICWLNGQRKKAPTPEEMMELEARRERVRQNVALLKKEEMERNSKEGKLRKIISTGQVMSPDLKSFIRQVPTGSEGTQTKRMQFERNQFQSPPSLLGLAIHLDPEHGSHMNDDCPSRRTRQH
ncbi:uncharacterized protein LOC103501588 isoform X4 [Cucumis melo]|uniref:Uncharacterized protein LOC103501588 isoform X4 n=1 Tax=Cucumis melo TaxID=3656 RepID=A0ABM3KV39_CUCME|nr:uncharacterized protein LOC103501588 isoform X4 [Cucumis melo]